MIEKIVENWPKGREKPEIEVLEDSDEIELVVYNNLGLIAFGMTFLTDNYGVYTILNGTKVLKSDSFDPSKFDETLDIIKMFYEKFVDKDLVLNMR